MVEKENIFFSKIEIFSEKSAILAFFDTKIQKNFLGLAPIPNWNQVRYRGGPRPPKTHFLGDDPHFGQPLNLGVLAIIR